MRNVVPIVLQSLGAVLGADLVDEDAAAVLSQRRARHERA
jgi:hypothetical protein